MANIFVSYARQDKARVAPIVAALERQGWSVWWDPAIIPGQEFDDRIAEEIDKASAVVVVWTPASVASRWVRGEAREAADRGILVPLRFDAARLPIDARAVHTTDLDGWDGNPNHPSFQDVVAALSALLKNAARSIAPAYSERPTSVCVLPFVNMSGDPEQEYFSDGISEDVITDLSKISALTVISRNSAFAFKGRHVDLPEVARQLNVTHVLEGSVRKVGGRVRITAQLIDGATNVHLWAERYDRNLEDIFALQDEISQAIVSALKVRLLPDEKKLLAERGTASIEAYDCFLRARALHSTSSGPEVRRSLDLYRKAVALDPHFAKAWAGLGAAIYVATIYYADLRATARTETEQAIARASELAPDLPDVHNGQLVLCLMRRDWARAEEHLASLDELGRAAIGVSGTPGMLQCVLGRANEAVQRVSLERQADPLALGLSFALQFYLGCAGRLKEAETEYERSTDLPGARANIEWRAITRAMALKDHPLVRQRFASAFGEDVAFMPFARALLKVIDQPDDALAIVRAAFEHSACQDGGRMGAIAHWAVYYGDEALALKALRRGYVELYGPTVAEIWSPVFAGPRRDPRFKEILRDIGLYDHWRRTGKWGDFARPIGDDDFEVIA